VAVVVELKARFDEASNIRWARNLQEAGVQVFHGVVGLKTHCKLALVARREADGQIRRYAHLGTGNYNPSTARYYTDLSLLTSDPQITTSVHHVFDYLTAYSERANYQPLFVAPLNLGRNCKTLIEREAAHARAGKKAFIFAKVNSLLDEQIIEQLYDALQAGVHIELIVRGACALRPGVRGVSNRIRVRSIIGRFLEHSRIFAFGNGGKTELYLGSADWMHRNIYERVEVMFHMRDPELCNQVYSEVIQPYLADTEKTRILQHDGTYVRENSAHAPANAREPFTFNVQEFLIGFAEGREAISEVPHAPATIKFPPMRPAANVPERKKTKGAKVRVAPAPPPSETAVPKA
jgi:polyphosphate kinase